MPSPGETPAPVKANANIDPSVVKPPASKLPKTPILKKPN